MSPIATSNPWSRAVDFARRSGWRAWAVVVLANVSATGLVGCGGEAGAPEPGTEIDRDVHPDAMPDDGAGSGLTELERNLLARAKGREWEDWSAGEVDEFLDDEGEGSRLLVVWDPRTAPGALALSDLVERAEEAADATATIVVAVYRGGDARSELIALRESQIPVDAVRIPRGGHAAQGLPGGEAIAARSGVEGVGRVPLTGPLE